LELSRKNALNKFRGKNYCAFEGARGFGFHLPRGLLNKQAVAFRTSSKHTV
jgi:hypothetical protein